MTFRATGRAAAWLLLAALAGGVTPGIPGFKHFYKCPSDADVTHLGDTKTPEACRAACEARPQGAGCWWLDGTGHFPRECRLCRTLTPNKQSWPNDWALPLAPAIS